MKVDNLEVVIKYSSDDDKISVVSDRPLSNGDVVLLLANLFCYLKEEDRPLATTLALQAALGVQSRVEDTWTNHILTH